MDANKSAAGRPIGSQVLLSWTPPPSGTFKLTVDGSRLSNSGCIAGGGLIRNAGRDLISGFTVNLGVGEILVAELWALYFGLKIAWELNIPHLIAEVDSALVVNLIS